MKAREDGQTSLLFEFARNSELEPIAKYLAAGGDVNVGEQRTGVRLLCIAAENGDLKLGQLLLDFAADPNMPSHAWPIHFAAGRGHLDFVELLLQAGSEVHCLDENGGTPLADAAASDHLEIVELLLESGADPKYRDRHGKRPILYAAEKGHRDIVDLLRFYSTPKELALVELRLNAFGNEDTSEAFASAKTAAYLGNIFPVVDYIAQNGNPNAFGLGGGTMLMSAANTGQIDIVKYLLHNGADPNHLDENGGFALSRAINANFAEVYNLLYPLTDKKLRKQADRDVERKRKYGMLKW